MATTEKMLPSGMMPGKNEIEKYIQLYEDDPEFTLADRIEDFDSSVLDKRYVDTFCSRYPYYTGVGNEVDAWIDGTRSRLGLIQFIHQDDLVELQNRERKFRDAPNEKTYKNLRAAFSTAIGTKVCVDFIKAQDASMTEEDRRKEEAEIKEREAAWDKRWEARKKICEIANADPDFLEDLEYYGLTEYELSIYDEMLEEEPLYVPDGYIKECKIRRGEYVIPITSVKFRMVRKQLKLNQRVFAKKIGYPNVNKYALLEQGRLAELGMTIYNAYPDELIKAVVDATYANPYWLMDHREESLYDVETESTAMTFEEADNWWMYPMFVDAKVIRYWWTHRK